VKPVDTTCRVVDVGLIPYGPASELQKRIVALRKDAQIPDVLLLCEHPHVITLGRNGHLENLRANDRVLRQMGVEFHDTDRGGDITYHGPGQIVGYPIVDLTNLRRDVRWYVSSLEEVMIRTAADFGVAARRLDGCHGIWVQTPAGEEKLAALGVHLSRWVTSHGIAFNVSSDLRYFDLIVPCGIRGKRATSLERVLNRSIRLDEVRGSLLTHFSEVFQRKLVPMSRRELEQFMESHDAEPRMIPAGQTPGESAA